jgi:hypothetical protein
LVGATLEDPIALGLIKSIPRPGTNVTGTWLAGDDALVGKRLGLLKDVVPGVSRVAAMLNPGDSSDIPLLRLLPATAHALDLKLLVIEVREASEFPVAFANVARDGQALFISSSPLFTSHRREIVAMAARLHLPAIYGWREFPEAGQFGRQFRQSIVLVLGETVDDCYVLALHIADVLEAQAECTQTVRHRVRRSGVKEPNHRQRWLLRARHERPRGRRAAKRG